MRFLDVGCGSGILSIMADKMRTAGIKAIDFDPIAVDNSLENFMINTVSAPYEIVCGSIEVCAGDTPYEFVCANIIKTSILEMLEKLDALTSGGGILVLSGLIAQDMPDIEAALKGRGLVNFEILADAEWRTIIVSKG
jgi:ribosomal protein L11 methyltransferase